MPVKWLLLMHFHNLLLTSNGLCSSFAKIIQSARFYDDAVFTEKSTPKYVTHVSIKDKSKKERYFKFDSPIYFEMIEFEVVMYLYIAQKCFHAHFFFHAHYAFGVIQNIYTGFLQNISLPLHSGNFRVREET